MARRDPEEARPDPREVPLSGGDAPRSPVAYWFARRHGRPTPVQEAAWPEVRAGKDVLLISPTGTGKTLAAFLAVLEDLVHDHAAGKLHDAIHCLYVSPLRALGYDMARNLEGPLREIYGDAPPIRVGIRSGDTEPAERARQFARPPHILVTTPESLCVMLSQPRWHARLATVRTVIVDELHALASNKRGAHLALSLERLGPVAGAFQRIGLSATIHPAAEAAAFLSGQGRQCSVVDAATAKRVDLRVYSPLRSDPYPRAGFGGERLMRELARLVSAHRTTLVFTNTRGGAESVAFQLRDRLPALADAIGCHHASLDRDVRLEVEDRLKRGELRAVVCSTSLELGIDIGSIDLVVMLSTPKGVARALQRAGRAGHDIRSVSRGLLMATNVNDLVECCATARLARAGHLDALRIPEAPLDVLAQHLMGLGCTGEWKLDDAFALVRRARPYRELSRADFDAVVDFLAGGGASLRAQYEELFGKIVLGDGVFEARAGAPRRDFLQNIGTIADEGAVDVLLARRRIGSVEESFVRGLRVGDVFSLGGRALRVERIGTMECEVRRADGAVPTVPRWGANKFPLANRVAGEIRSFRSEIRPRLEAGEPAPALRDWIAHRLECGAANAAVIHRVHAAQHAVSEVPTGDFLLVEEFAGVAENRPEPPPRRRRPAPGPPDSTELSAAAQLAMAAITLPATAASAPPPARRDGHDGTPARHLFFHALIGRSANDALARVVGLRLSRRRGGNAITTADDYGFVLTVAPDQSPTSEDLPALLAPDDFERDLDEALKGSELLKYHFRAAAQTGLMVYRNHFGNSKSVRKVQWSAEVIFNVLVRHEPGHVLLREARRDTMHAFLDAPRALAYLRDLGARGLPVRRRAVALVPPLSFGMYATRIKEALLVEDPAETLERLHNLWWERLRGHAPDAA